MHSWPRVGRLDRSARTGHTGAARHANAGGKESSRMANWQASTKNAPSDAARKDGDPVSTRMTRVVAGAQAAFILSTLATGALAQPLNPPQPTARPQEFRTAPLTQPDAVAPTMPKNAPRPTAPGSADVPVADPKPRLSGRELRAIQHACAQEWTDMMKAGRAVGLTWGDFFPACRMRHAIK